MIAAGEGSSSEAQPSSSAAEGQLTQSEAPAFLLVHGFGAFGEQWRGQVKALTAAGYQVHTLLQCCTIVAVSCEAVHFCDLAAVSCELIVWVWGIWGAVTGADSTPRCCGLTGTHILSFLNVTLRCE